jgi:hypothetical protein
VSVALRGAFSGTLMRGGADRLGELGLDQRLIDHFGVLACTIPNIGDLQCIQNFEQGRLVQGLALCPSTCSLAGSRRDSRGGLFNMLRHAEEAPDLDRADLQ